jgi:hypothetical protein
LLLTGALVNVHRLKTLTQTRHIVPFEMMSGYVAIADICCFVYVRTGEIGERSAHAVSCGAYHLV